MPRFIKNMDSFEINKIIAAILLTVLIIIVLELPTLFLCRETKETAYKVDGLGQL